MQYLLTVLGKGRNGKQAGYRSARYLLPDGTVQETKFIGLTLAAYLKSQAVILLGTAGSMWGVLVENFATEGQDEDLRMQLLEAEESATVDQALLDRIKPLLIRAVGCDVIPRIIPPGRDGAEQIGILGVIADAIPTSAEVHFDLTHGFRHLGMVGFLSAFMLEKLHQRVTVKDLWYGALEMSQDDVAPLLRLDGLVAVHRWVSALERFDASGDYGVFAPLLEADGLPKDKAKCLVDAAFHESTSNVSDAALKLKTVLPSLEQPLNGASELFRLQLLNKLKWARREDLADQQRLLAQRALKRGDPMRAAVLGLESLVTRLCCDAGKAPLDYRERVLVEKEFQGELRNAEHPGWIRDAYWTLSNLRNAMAHGTLPKDRPLREILKDPGRLQTRLESVLSQLTST